MNYNELIDPKCSKATNEMRIRHLKVLDRIMIGVQVSDKFHYGFLFDFEQTIKKLEDVFESPFLYGLKSKQPLSLETRISYMASVCKVLHYIHNFPSDIYLKYDEYYRNLKDLKLL